MIGESEIKRIGERVLGASRADQTEVEVFANDSALTRFANNYIHQNVEHSDVDVRVRAVIGQKIGNPVYIAWAVKKGHAGAYPLMNKALLDLRASGDLYKLQKKWFGATFEAMPQAHATTAAACQKTGRGASTLRMKKYSVSR